MNSKMNNKKMTYEVAMKRLFKANQASNWNDVKEKNPFVMWFALNILCVYWNDG